MTYKSCKMDHPRLSRWFCFCLFMLGINLCMLAQDAKPSYVLKYLPEEAEYDYDPFLNKLSQYLLQALHQLDQVDVISPFTSSKYPAQYYLEVRPSYYYYGWKKGTYHLVQDDPQRKKMLFEYRMNYRPKINLTLGDITTGRVLEHYELKLTSSFPPERRWVDYEDILYDVSLTFQPADVQKYIERAKPTIFQMFDKSPMDAEKVLKNELSQAVYEVLFQFFPARHQVLGFKSLRFDSAAIDIQGFENYSFRPIKPIFIYGLKPFRHGVDTDERIELLGEFYTTTQKGKFLAGLFTGSKNNVSAALNNKEPIWCSPIRLKYAFNQVESPPSLVFNIRTSGVSIDPLVLKKLHHRLKEQILDARGKQLIVLNREKFTSIEWQRDKNKSGSFLDKPFIEQFKSIGARYILDVEIQNAGAAYTEGNFTFGFRFVPRLIDVETTEIISENLSNYGAYWGKKAFIEDEVMEYRIISALSPETRLEFVKNLGLLSHLEFNIREVLNRSIPAKIQVHELTEIEKDKAKQVLMSGNFNEMTRKDDYHVCIKKEINVDGTMETRWEVIGRVAIHAAAGEGLALAKVKQGEKEIYAAFQKGVKLYCFDRPDWLIDGQFTWQLKIAGF